MEKQRDFNLLAKIHNISLEETDPVRLDPGSRLGPEGRYEIINLIGVGSIGAVYLARDDHKKGQLIAIKIILPYMISKLLERRLQVFSKHLDTLQKIDHPNIIKVYDIYQEDSFFFYTMEQGENLRKFYQNDQKISCSDICLILINICQALSFLHKYSGHYRIHPENIICLNAGSSMPLIKICDFGIYFLQSHKFWCKAAGQLERDNYQAPEHHNKLVRLNWQSDIYSMGNLLSEMLSTWFSGSAKDKISEIREGVPPEVDAIITMALQPEPEKRQKNSAELLEQLQTALTKAYQKQLGSLSSELESVKEKSSNDENSGLQVDKSVNSEKYQKNESVDESTAKQNEKSAGAKGTKTGETDVKRQQYEEYLVLCQELVKEKRWEEVVEYCKKALQIQESVELRKFLEIAGINLKKARELKDLAEQMRDDPYPCLDLLRQSMEIYPQDNNTRRLYKKVEDELENQKSTVEDLLAKGDMLVRMENYQAALGTWKKALGFSTKDKEVRDRIMQVVDMMGEEAREYLEDGHPYQSKEILDRIIDYTDDALIIDLYEEVMNEVQDREKHFQTAWEESEKHFAKKQFNAAAEILQNALGFTEKDGLLKKKIEEAHSMQQQIQDDEDEYLRLASLARALEQKEDYETALHTLERIRQYQAQWLCPTSNVTTDIERLTKLVASTGVSFEARKILTEVSKAIEAGDFDTATSSLANPIFRRKLLPSVEKKYHSLQQQIHEKVEQTKRRRNIVWAVILVIIVIILIVGMSI